MVQGFLVYGTLGRQDRCFLSAREPLSNESLTGYAFVKAMNWKFSHLRFKVDRVPRAVHLRSLVREREESP